MLALVASLSLGLGAATPIALYPLQASQPRANPELSAEAIAAIDVALRGQIGDLRSYKLFDHGQTESLIVPPGGLGLNCDDGKPECLASLGRLLGAAVMVFGRVGTEGVELQLIDVRTGQEVHRVHIANKPSGKPGDDAREACIALLAPDRYTGAIEVTGEHGRLAIDNADRADLPLDGPVVLPVGRHQVTVTLPGRTSWNAVVDIFWRQCAHLDGARAPLAPPGTVPEIAYTPQPVVDIPESHPAPRPERRMSDGRRLAYLGLTIGILSGAAGIILGAISEDNVQALQGQVRPVPVSQAGAVAQEASRARDFGVAADIVWGTAAALGIASAVLYFASPEYAPERSFESGRVEVNGAGALVRF